MSENKQQTILIPNRETSESQLYSPFGPLIGYKKLSDELVNILNEGVNNHEKGSETLEDHSDYLVGKIQEELTFSEHHVAATMRELIPFIKEYLVASKSRELMVPATLGKDTDINVAVDGAWFVRSFAGDFNPIHTHTDCLLSCIGYLNIPEELEKEWEDLMNTRKDEIAFLVRAKEIKFDGEKVETNKMNEVNIDGKKIMILIE